MTPKESAKIFKALSHPNRLELFLEIARLQETSYADDDEDSCFISDMMRSLKIGAPTISHHLKELANANIIITERKGKFLTARINRPVLREVRKLLPA